MLRVLSIERLNVTELTAVLGLAQSGVSRHLGLLRKTGLVQESREGGFVYYTSGPAPGLTDVWALLERHFTDAADDPAVRADEARLREVQRARKERFETHGTDAGQLVPGGEAGVPPCCCGGKSSSTRGGAPRPVLPASVRPRGCRP